MPQRPHSATLSRQRGPTLVYGAMTQPLSQPTDPARGDEILRLQQLSKTFRVGFWAKRVHAVRDVNAVMYRGESLGYLGPNGSGKTTSIKCLLALIQPTAGKVELFGRSPTDPAARARVGYLPESPYFYDYLTPVEIFEYVGKLYGLDARTRRSRTQELLGIVGLDLAAKRPLRGFSKGMLQRVGIAQSLIADPDLLIWDEPLSGLDPLGRKEIRELMIELRRQGKSLFFSSHVLTDIEALCDGVCILDRGVAVAQGRLSELLHRDALESEALLQLPPDPAQSAAVQVQLGNIPDLQLKQLPIGVQAVLPTDRVPELMRVLLEGGGQLRELTARRDSLEDLFMRKALQRSDEGRP